MAKYKADCYNCPYDEICGNHDNKMLIDTLNLINRQKAEIERLNKEVETFADIGKMYSEIKAEAYREFAVRLLALIGSVELPNLELRRHINNLLNELVGDSNG